MATTTQARTTISPELLNTANALLEWLVSNANSDWERILSQTLDNTKEAETNAARARRTLERLNRSEPVGALVGGTNIAKTEAGFEGELATEAMQLLKQTNRVQQAGRGRGRALIVLDGRPLDGDEDADMPVPSQAEPVEAATPAPLPAAEVLTDTTDTSERNGEAMIPADNLPALLLAARDTYRSLTHKLEEAQRELRRSEAARAEMAAEISELAARTVALQEQLDEQAVSTWR